ncbi:MAG: hypothetical protein ACI87W_000252 [Halieaceae bacterium]
MHQHSASDRATATGALKHPLLQAKNPAPARLYSWRRYRQTQGCPNGSAGSAFRGKSPVRSSHMIVSTTASSIPGGTLAVSQTATGGLPGAQAQRSGIAPGKSISPNGAQNSDAGARENNINAASGSVNRASSDRQSINRLTEQERQQRSELSARDREVRAHEQAHANVGGRYAGSPSYTYQRGPDGRQYAVGGEVSIDTSPVPGDPQATIEKARVVRRAALAPTQPSPQDRAIAAEATATEQQARAELLAQKAEPGTPNAGAEGNDKAALPSYRPIDIRV